MKRLTITLLALLMSMGAWTEEIRLSCKAYYYWTASVIPPYEQKEYETQRASMLINTTEKSLSLSVSSFTLEFEYLEEGNNISFKNPDRTIWYTLDRVTGEFRRLRVNLSNGYRKSDTKFRCAKTDALF